jgi:hypothetical protein
MPQRLLAQTPQRRQKLPTLLPLRLSEDQETRLMLLRELISQVQWLDAIIGWYHAYVVTTDPNGGQNYFRGGPSAGGPSGGSSGQLGGASSGSNSWGPIITETGPYLPGTVDYQTGNPPSVTVHEDDKPCTCIDEKFSKTLKDIEAAKIPYNPFGPNSNSVAKKTVESGGFSAPTPPVWVPGWNTPLPM